MRHFLMLLMAFVLLSMQNLHARETVRISLFSWPGYAFWFIAQDQDLVPELDLDIRIIEDPYDSFALMASDNLDVTSSTIEYGPIAADQGLPIEVVAYTNPSYGVDKIILAPGVSSVEEVVGERIAVMVGGLQQIMVGIWLEDNDINIDEVEFANLIMDDAIGAMVSGSVAAGQFWEPFAREVLDIFPNATVAATSSEDYWIETGLLGDGMYMRSGFIEDDPELAALTMDAYFKAVEFWKENPTEGNQIIADALSFSVEDVELIIGSDGNTREGGIHVFDRNEAARFFGLMPGEPPLGLSNGQMHEHWDLTSTWWERFGLIESIYSSDEGINFSVMENMLSLEE